jgi:hypothetical protein
MRKTVISLFDYTGIMVEPWRNAGYRCIIVDLQHPAGVSLGDRVHLFKIGADLRNGFDLSNYSDWFESADIVMVVGFPECTNVAVSGAKHFLNKGPRALALSLDLFATCKELGEATGAPYMIENPVSTFSTYCGKPDHIFHPYDYGGYLPPDDEHPTYPEYIAPRDAYPKKTCLWTGNGFIMPEPRPVEPEPGSSRQHNKLGGKSLKTKNIRSATPRGFAQAVFEANKEQKVERVLE